MPSLTGEFVITKQPVWTGVGHIVRTHTSVQSLYLTSTHSGTNDDDDEDNGNNCNNCNNNNQTQTSRKVETRTGCCPTQFISSSLSHHHPHYMANSTSSQKNPVDHNNNNSSNRNSGNWKVVNGAWTLAHPCPPHFVS